MSESFETFVRVFEYVKLSRHRTYFVVFLLRRKDTRDAVIVQSVTMAQPRPTVAICYSTMNGRCYTLFRRVCCDVAYTGCSRDYTLEGTIDYPVRQEGDKWENLNPVRGNNLRCNICGWSSSRVNALININTTCTHQLRALCVCFIHLLRNSKVVATHQSLPRRRQSERGENASTQRTPRAAIKTYNDEV